MVLPEPDGYRPSSFSNSGARCSAEGLPMSSRCRPGEWKRRRRMDPIEPSRMSNTDASKNTVRVPEWAEILRQPVAVIGWRYNFELP